MSAAGTAPRSNALRASHWVAVSRVSRKLHLATGEERYQQAVAIEQPVAGQRGKLGSRGQDAHKIERVGAGQ